MGSAVIVELLGPPGAGKTALMSSAVDALTGWSGRRCEAAGDALDRHLARSLMGRLLGPIFAGRPRRRRAMLVDLPFGAAFLLSRPLLTLTALRAILRAPVGWSHRWTLLMRWTGVGARQRFLRPRVGNDIVVFDEGLYHRSVNLFAWRATARRRRAASSMLRHEIAVYLRLAPAPDLAIFVGAASEVTDQRLAARGLPLRLRDRPPAQVARFLSAAGEISRLIPGEARQRTTLISLENESTLEAVAQSLRDALQEIPWSGKSAPARWPTEPHGRRPVIRPDGWWKSRARRLAPDERRELAEVAAAFGIDDLSSARSLGAGRSWNVLVDTGRRRVLLKRYKQTVDATAIASEHFVLGRLRELGIPAPCLIPAQDGTTVVQHGDRSFVAFSYLDGYWPMHQIIEAGADRRRRASSAGRALATIHQVLAADVPAAFPENGLDRRGARRDASTALADELQRAVSLLPAAGLKGSMAAPRLCVLDEQLRAASLQTSLIHGDYGPYNILVRPGEPFVVIDYELARFDWRLIDLVTAAPRFAVSRIGFSADRFAAFVGGYLAVAPEMHPEIVMAPALLEFLDLRRAAVCVRRARRDGKSKWISEADARLRHARLVANGSHRLVRAFEAVRA